MVFHAPPSCRYVTDSTCRPVAPGPYAVKIAASDKGFQTDGCAIE